MLLADARPHQQAYACAHVKRMQLLKVVCSSMKDLDTPHRDRQGGEGGGGGWGGGGLDK